MSASRRPRPQRLLAPSLPAALLLLLGPSACASEPEPAELDRALARALLTHGWECDVIESRRDLEEGWHEVECRDGRRYEIRFGPAWSPEEAERRTTLRPLLDLARHARALQSQDPAARLAAAEALAKEGEGAAPALGALIAALDDPDPGVRLAVVEALGAIGPDAEAATRPLERLARGAEPPLDAAARAALARIAPGGG
jgi:hypothetical protein